jgi:hypothetical protein
MDRVRSFIDRLLPALIAAGGVALLAAGLMTVLDPAAAQAELSQPVDRHRQPIADAELFAVSGADPLGKRLGVVSGSLEPSVASRSWCPPSRSTCPSLPRASGRARAPTRCAT